MRLGGSSAPPAPPAAPPAERYKSPAEDVFDAFFAVFDETSMLTLMQVKTLLEAKPRPAFLSVSGDVRRFFEDIADELGISDP